MSRYCVAPAWSVTVADRGEGIQSRSTCPRLTERFYRVDAHHIRAAKGHWLRFAIVKPIVSRHRGRLRIESTRAGQQLLPVILPGRPWRLLICGTMIGRETLRPSGRWAGSLLTSPWCDRQAVEWEAEHGPVSQGAVFAAMSRFVASCLYRVRICHCMGCQTPRRALFQASAIFSAETPSPSRADRRIRGTILLSRCIRRCSRKDDEIELVWLA